MKKLVGLLVLVVGVASGQTVIATVNVGSYPAGVAVNPAGTRAYVANLYGDSVSVIDTSNNTVTATVNVGSYPYGVAVNPAGTRAYVTNSGGNTVSVINTATNLVTATVGVGSNPRGVAVNPAGTLAYVANLSGNSVSVIDTSNNTVTATVNVGSYPYGVAVNPAGTRAYVANLNGNSVSVIDTSNNTVTATVNVGSYPAGVAVNPAGTLAYVTNLYGDSVSVIDTATNSATATVAVRQPYGVAVNPAGTRAYVTNLNGNTVSVIDTATNLVTATVTVGRQPYGVAVNPAGTRAYVANLNGNSVSVIDTATATAPAPVPLQITPLSSVSISVVPNQSLLGTGTATVVANQSGTWTATTSTPWLSLTQSSGGFPGVVAGTANAAGLAAGSYTGSISVAGTAPGGIQTITIPVTLTVNTPAALTATPTAISMASSYPAGSATGYTIQTGASGLAFTALTSASSAGWLTVSPTSGIAPTPITVTLDPSKATPGIYTDSIVVSSAGVASVTVPVKMSVSGLIATLPQQVNSGTAAGPDRTVAPNEIVSLYLTNFSCATAPVVSINGTAVSWSSYAPGQINYAVPANITSPAALTVACNGTTAWTFNGLTTAAVVPGIFTLTGTGKGQAAVVNSDGTINGGTNPATRGSWLSVYGTGFGVFNAAGTNGLRTVAGAVTATLGGVDATVLYAGNTPGATDGLQQFNLQIPAGVTAGTAVPIVLTVNGTPTQTTATVSLK